MPEELPEVPAHATPEHKKTVAGEILSVLFHEVGEAAFNALLSLAKHLIHAKRSEPVTPAAADSNPDQPPPPKPPHG